MTQALECRRTVNLTPATPAFPGPNPVIDHLPFKQIWAVDFALEAAPGENPEPICLVALELRSGRIVRLWQNEFVSTRLVGLGQIRCSSPY